MDNSKQIEVRVLIQNLLGMPEHSVRPADSSQPTAGINYAIVQLTDMVAQGWAGGYKSSYQATMATLTIDFMGNKSATYAQQLKMAMQTPYALDTLFDLGMGFIDCSDPRNLTALELERVKRHQVKLQLSYEVQYDMPTTIPPDYQDHYQNEHDIETVPIGMKVEPYPAYWRFFITYF